MTDKEFKRLSRSQLIDIIYQFQLTQNELNDEIERLKKALDDRRLRVKEAGNIADAALEITNVMQAAQDAATLYLEEIRTMREETKIECQRLLENAQKEAESIIGQAREGKALVDPALEAIVKEFASKNNKTGEWK